MPEPNASEVGQRDSIGEVDLYSSGVRKGVYDSTMRVKWSCSYECEFSGATLRPLLSARALVAGSEGLGRWRLRSDVGLAAARSRDPLLKT